MTDLDFETELHRHYPDLLRMARARLREYKLPVDLADDMVQEAVAKAWARREHITPQEAVRGYLVIAVLNCVQDLVREHSRTTPAVAKFAQETREDEDPEEQSQDEAHERQLATLDRLLPEIPDHRARTALYLVARWGVSLRMAAEIMQVDPSNLWNREYTDALAWLRDKLAAAA